LKVDENNKAISFEHGYPRVGAEVFILGFPAGLSKQRGSTNLETWSNSFGVAVSRSWRIFLFTTTSALEGGYVSPTRVVTTQWGLGGVVYPDRIVWYRAGMRRPVAAWVRNAACPF
jgi:hypothetical protein